MFVCTWKRTPDGFDVWVERRRSLRASAATFEQADELLTSAITLATGDGENEHEYDPPRPDTATDDGLLRRFKLIAGGGWATLANEAELWTRGVCPTCQRAWGRRTNRAAVLATLEAVADGLIAKPRTGWALRLQLYCNEFLRLLTVAERRRFEWRPAVAPRRTKRQYFEIVGSRATFPLATFKIAYVGHSLFTCPTCRGRNDPCGIHSSRRRPPASSPRAISRAACPHASRWAPPPDRPSASPRSAGRPSSDDAGHAGCDPRTSGLSIRAWSIGGRAGSCSALSPDLSLPARPPQVTGFARVAHPVSNGIAIRFCRHTSQEVCPWNVKFARPVKEPSFQPRAAIAGKDAKALAAEILAMSEDEFRAAFKGSAMKRAKLAGLRRNANLLLRPP